MRRFKQVDLNKASWPQAHCVEIPEGNDDKFEYSSDNGEEQNEEVIHPSISHQY